MKVSEFDLDTASVRTTLDPVESWIRPGCNAVSGSVAASDTMFLAWTERRCMKGNVLDQHFVGQLWRASPRSGGA